MSDNRKYIIWIILAVIGSVALAFLAVVLAKKWV